MVLYRHRQNRCKFSNKSPKRKENITPWCFLRPPCSSSLPTEKLRPSAVAQAYCLALRQRPVKRLLASKHLNIQTHPNTSKATYYRNYFEITTVCKEWPTSNTCFFFCHFLMDRTQFIDTSFIYLLYLLYNRNEHKCENIKKIYTHLQMYKKFTTDK